MDKYERKEITEQTKFAKNTCCDRYGQLIKYIPEAIKTRSGDKCKIMSIFKTNTTKDSSKPTRFKKGMVDEKN